jgi:hypothetical protein
MSRFRQGLITAFVLGTLLNIWFLLGAEAGYKYYGIVQQLDAFAARQFAFWVEIALVAASAIAWWLSRP